jgi:hypothetical protein
MTFDQLVFNYELAKANAARSGSCEDRETYFDLVGYYEKRIKARSQAVAFWTGTPPPLGSPKRNL